MKTKNLPIAFAFSSFLIVTTANATDVEVHIQNLSNEVIRTSDTDFPIALAPGESRSVTLNQYSSSSHVSVSYTSTSGKTCVFSGGHSAYGNYNVDFKKDAVGSQSYNNCGAILTVQKWSPPYRYRLGFWMTD